MKEFLNIFDFYFIRFCKRGRLFFNALFNFYFFFYLKHKANICQF